MKQIYESIRTNDMSPTSNTTSALSIYPPPPSPPSHTTTTTSITTTKNYDEHYKFDVIMFGKNDDMSKFNDEIEKNMKDNKEMMKLKLSSYISEKQLLGLTNDWRVRLNGISSRSVNQSNRRSRIINILLSSLSIMPELSDNLIEYKHIPKLQDIHGMMIMMCLRFL
jgi:hypothetical protein